MFNKGRVTAVLALIFSFSLLSTAAYGIGRSWVNEGHVYVCVNRANGDMHAVQEDTSCKSTEELVVVPTGSGAQGATGAKGDTGATGAKGDTGANGAKGDAGANGAVGATGAQGRAGAAGTDGSQGATGPAGAQGATGVQGPAGDTGANGAAGATGAVGATGAQGPRGDTGANGAAGATGAPGPQGDTGANGAVGATGAQGPNGDTGSAGATGAQGATGVAGTTGQLAVTVTSTSAGATVSTAAMGPTAVPGLSTRVDVTSRTAVLYVETDGTVTNNGAQVNDYTSVDVRVLVDGVVQDTRTVDVELGKFAFRGSWSMAFSLPAAAGTHTVTVDTQLHSASAQNGQSPSATVGGSGRGSLTVLVLNK